MKTLSAPSAPLVRTSAASAAKPHPPHPSIRGAGCGAEACAEIYWVRKMTPELHRRLAEIEAARRRHVDALSRLSAEAQKLIAALAGAGPGAPDATSPDTPTPPIDLDNLASIPQAAADFGVSDKTLRKWARKHSAIVTIGGRVYADVSILTASVISRKVPQISLSIDAPTRKTARRAKRKQS